MAFNAFKKILGLQKSGEPSGPPGCRAYVVGDIHGRLDLLTDLMRQIETDMVDYPEKRKFLIFVGDLIDRGPDSAGVVEFLSRYRPSTYEMIFLMGNHEETFLRVLSGNEDAMVSWFGYGGRECAASYGVRELSRINFSTADLIAELRKSVPAKHRKFIREFDDSFRFGDYLCVHAGVRPGIALEKQKEHDLRWIREEFLNSTVDHGFVAVHGHTVVDEVEELPNRIGIDTGAYHTGRLTALVIDGTQKSYLATNAETRMAADASSV